MKTRFFAAFTLLSVCASFQFRPSFDANPIRIYRHSSNMPRQRKSHSKALYAEPTPASSPLSPGAIKPLASSGQESNYNSIVGLSFEIVGTSLFTALIVIVLKRLLSGAEVMRSQLSVLSPLIAGVIVSFLYLVVPDLSLGPAHIITSKFSMFRFLFRAAATVATIGGGVPLAVLGICVEAGLVSGRIFSSHTAFSPSDGRDRSRRRGLLMLAGAAAGAAAALDAPLTGIAYALEV